MQNVDKKHQSSESSCFCLWKWWVGFQLQDYFGKSCSERASALTFGETIMAKEANFAYTYYDLPAIASERLGNHAEIQFECSFSRTYHSNWISDSPQLLLLSVGLSRYYHWHKSLSPNRSYRWRLQSAHKLVTGPCYSPCLSLDKTFLILHEIILPWWKWDAPTAKITISSWSPCSVLTW